MSSYDVVVVGAGPAGAIVAEAVSKSGYRVLVLEEHGEVGRPVQCTGLVSRRLGVPEGLVLNEVGVARFFSGGHHFEVRSREGMLVIDREGYDRELVGRAVRAGAELRLAESFVDFEGTTVRTSGGRYETKLLVGADGPNSDVARACGLELPKGVLLGAQYAVEGEFERGAVELWFGSRSSSGAFAWVVPVSGRVARVGLFTRDRPLPRLEAFLRARFGRRPRVLERAVDSISYGLIRSSVRRRVLLVGDAASQVKPFSLGGLVYGKIGAEAAGRACVRVLEREDFSEEALRREYEVVWKGALGAPIARGMLLRTLFGLVEDVPPLFSLARALGLGRLASSIDVDLLPKRRI